MAITLNKKELLSIKSILQVFFFLALLTGCVIPSFKFMGVLYVQIFSPVLLSVVVSSIALSTKKGAQLLSVAFNIFFLQMLLFSGVEQVVLQYRNIRAGQGFTGWINTFYYDKLLATMLVWATAMAWYTSVKLFKKTRQKGFDEKYDTFFNVSSRGFLVFYAAVLLYGFVIIRVDSSQAGTVNLVPFKTIAGYFTGAKHLEFENFFLFLGNILILMPMGFFLSVKKDKICYPLLAIVPVIVSSAVELSQALFRNGDCDVDDVILNTAGFCFGFFVKTLLDKAIRKKAGNPKEVMFNWRPISFVSQKAQ